MALDVSIIEKHPIQGELDAFRDKFNSTYATSGLHVSSDAIQQLGNKALKNLALKLILALQNTSTAFAHPSCTDLISFFSDLSSFNLSIESGDFDIENIIPLLKQVIERASDYDIWSTVFTLLVPKPTPPIINRNALLDTPHKSNSSSHRGSEQIHDMIDSRIFQEIHDCVYLNTSGFYKHFEGRSWSTAVEKIVLAVNPQKVNGVWTEYPDPSQSAFFTWFWRFQKDFFQKTLGIYETSHNKPLPGDKCARQPDLFLRLAKHEGKCDWKDVRVIGELKSSVDPGKFKDELVAFCGNAREVFKSQPTRRFLHGFFIRRSMFEPWIIDRSGLYSGEKFDICKFPDRFIQVMAGYALMSDEELGMDTYIKKDEIGDYIMFKREDEKEEGKLYLENKPIAFQRAIICRGTTCYRAKRQNSKRWEFVVKFSWRSDMRGAEGDLLKLAKDKNVWGIARLFGHQDLDSISNLRQGMHGGKQRKFSSATKSSASIGQSGISSLFNGQGISQHSQSFSSGQKRKQQGETSSSQSKRSKPMSSLRQSETTDLTSGQTRPEEANRRSVEQPKTTSLMCHTRPNHKSFDNRILSILVTFPPGRPIHEFKSVNEFLEAFRDIIRAHKSLFQDGNILHRDVSENNLIITDTEDKSEPRGMLIDLDLAKRRDSESCGARHRTGTMEFMAIEVLEGKAHTYRHDLESLFYVFLWVIIQGKKRSLPDVSKLRGWYTGTYAVIAITKGGQMDKKNFELLLDEFPPEFQTIKELARGLRDILFPWRQGLFTGTYCDPDYLYEPMIDAFNSTIVRYTANEPDGSE